jgi:hypothetical protein
MLGDSLRIWPRWRAFLLTCPRCRRHTFGAARRPGLLAAPGQEGRERRTDASAQPLPAPKVHPRLHHGRNGLDERAALAGIVFVHKHGIGWANVPS